MFVRNFVGRHFCHDAVDVSDRKDKIIVSFNLVKYYFIDFHTRKRNESLSIRRNIIIAPANV